MPKPIHRLLLCVFAGLVSVFDLPAAELHVGVDMNYALEMERAGKTWTVDGASADVFKTLAAAGCDSFRVRLWVGDDGVNGLAYATETARRAQAAGLKPYLVIFLSDQWSDFVKQPRPAIWKDLDEAALLAAVETYAERVTRHFAEAGLAVDVFAIGNEIDFGICGVFEEAWPKRMSLDYMKGRIWPRMAPIIAAAQNGVRKVRPEAKFILHLTQWENAGYCLAFWRAMRERGVTVDLAGLSYFPTAAATKEHRTLDFLSGQVARIATEMKTPVMICETGFPTQAAFGGQFADWNKPVPGYALDESAQRAWIADLLRMLQTGGHVAGAYYWSPEWAGSEIWGAFALFDPAGKARPGLKGFADARLPKPAGAIAVPPKAAPKPLKSSWGGVPVYFGNLHSHTSLSDGQGTPADAFTQARDVGGMDFLAVTEHNHLMGGDKASPEKREALYAGPADTALVPTARRLTEDGKFIAFYGQEFSSMSKGNHVNIFDVDAVIHVPNGEFAQLLSWLDTHRDTTGAVPVVQFNHPALGSPFPPFPQLRNKDYGRDDFGDEAGWIKRMGEVTFLIEVLNGEPPEGSADRRAPQVMENYYQRFLQLGFRLAPTGNQDNHKPNWGTATDVRTGIMAAKLTKADLLAAIRARHVYATEDKNLRLAIRVGDHDCGDVISGAGPLRDLPVAVRIEDLDEPDATYTVEAFVGKIGGPLATAAKSFTVTGNTQGAPIVGNLDLEEPGRFVFFRITQKSVQGEDRAWTAPVWLDSLN